MAREGVVSLSDWLLSVICAKISSVLLLVRAGDSSSQGAVHSPRLTGESKGGSDQRVEEKQYSTFHSPTIDSNAHP